MELLVSLITPLELVAVVLAAMGLELQRMVKVARLKLLVSQAQYE
tara:strand:+ start:892 stop:1026 length:135 start_codon:yes stop_codon:yes gene_type:complete